MQELIKFEKSTIGFSVYQFRGEKPSEILARLMRDERVDLARKKSGFLVVETGNGGLIRGDYFTILEEVVPDLVDGFVTSKKTYVPYSCEFAIRDGRAYVWGDAKARRACVASIAILDGLMPVLESFTSEDLVRFQHRLSVVSSIAIRNPKSKEVRRVRMVGKVEDYTTCNVLDPCNHEIESVAGTYQTPRGEAKVTVGKRGSVRLGFKVGSEIEVGDLGWLVDRIKDVSGLEA